MPKLAVADLQTSNQGYFQKEPLSLPVSGEVNAVAWTHAGDELAAISKYGSVVTLWDPDTWKITKQYKRYSGAYSLNSLSFLADGTLLTSAPVGDYSNGSKIEDLSTVDPKYKTLEIFSLIVWDPNKAKAIRYIPDLTASPDDHSVKVTDTFVTSSDGTNVAAISGKTVLIYDSIKAMLVRKIAVPKIEGKDDYAKAVAFSPNGQELAIGTLAGLVYFVDVRSGSLLGSLSAFGSRWYGCSDLQYSPDGNYIAVGKHSTFSGQLVDGKWKSREPSDVAVTIWNVESKKLLISLKGSTVHVNGGEDAANVRSLSWDPTGEFLAVADDVGLRIWSVDYSGEENLLKNEILQGAYDVKFSSLGKLAVAKRDAVLIYQ